MTTGWGTKAAKATKATKAARAAEARPGAEPSREEALRLYETMTLIRRTEERLRDDSAAGRLPGAVHLFSEFSPAAQVTAGRIADRARAFAVPAREVDGNDVTEVWRAAGEAVARARGGGGPSFIEARTYRIQGHFEAESFVLSGGRYREEAEIERWRRADPVARYRAALTGPGTAADADLGEIDAAVLARVDGAVRFAEDGHPAD